jgi:hypothetical protein
MLVLGRRQTTSKRPALRKADFGENLVAIFVQTPSSSPLRSKLSNNCRCVCSARGGNLLKRHESVDGYPFQIVLHFTNSHTDADPFIDGEL